MWFLNYKDGEMPFKLKELGAGEFNDPMGALVQYLIFSQEALHKVENLMNRPPIEVANGPLPNPDKAITMEDVQKENNVPKLKKMAKELNPQVEFPQGAKKDEVKEVLFQLLAETAER
jgi:hypothetical protein